MDSEVVVVEVTTLQSDGGWLDHLCCTPLLSTNKKQK